MSDLPPDPPLEGPPEEPPAEVTPGPAPAPKKKRRWLKWLAIAGGTFVLVLVAAPFLVLQWVASEAGGDYLRRQIVQAAGDAIEGRVDVGRVKIAGLLRLEIDDFKLTAPGDTEPVVAIAKIVADVRVMALLSRRVELSEFTVDTPVVHLVKEGETTNLARATKSKGPPKPPEPEKPAGPPEEPPEGTIAAPDMHLKNGRVEVVGGEKPVRVEGLAFDGAIEGTAKELVVALALRADVKEPVDRHVATALRTVVHAKDATLEHLTLDAGDTHFAMHGGGAFDGSRGELVFDRGHVAASDVKALVPTVDLLGDVQLTGSAGLSGGQAKVALAVALPAGKISLDAKAAVTIGASGDPVGAWTASLDVDGVEPQRILAGQLDTGGRLHATAAGTGTPGQGTATFALDAGGSRYQKLVLDEAVVAGSLAGLQAHLDKVRLATAGVAISATGDAGAESGDLKVRLELPSLAATRTALAAGLGLELAPMAGSVTLETDVKGLWTEPRVALRLEAPLVVYDTNRVEGLTAAAKLDRLPPRPVGSYEFAIGAVKAGGLDGKLLAGKGDVDGQKARADMSGVLDGRRVDMHLKGERQPPPGAGLERWTFDELLFDVLGLKEKADAVTTLEFGNGGGRVENLRMSGDVGQIVLDGHGGASGPIEGHFALTGLVLQRLPHAILKKELGLTGVLSLDTKVTGTAASPTIDATVKLAEAGYKDFKPYGVALDAHVADGRAESNVKVTLPSGGRSSLTVNVPLGSPAALSAMATPPAVEANFSIDNFDLALAKHFAPDLPPMAGRYSGTLGLKGSYAVPELTSRSALTGFAGWGVTGLDATLELAETASGRFGAHVTAHRGPALGASFDVSMPLDGKAIILGKMPDFLTIPYDATFAIDTLDLAWLASMDMAPADLAGRVAGKIGSKGTAKAPTADGTITLTDLATGGYRDVDLTMDLTAKDDVKFGAQASLGGKPLATLVSRFAGSIGGISAMTRAQQYALPFELDLKLLATPFARLTPEKPKTRGDDEGARTTGLLAAALHAEGTADEPVLRFTSAATELRYAGQDVGRLDLDYGYRGQKSEFSATFQSKGAGDIVVVGAMPGDLGVTAVMAEKNELMQRPLEMRIDATAFNLALANGLVPGMRDIAGTLDMHLRKEGPAATPNLVGTIDLRGARAALLEYGDFRDMDLNVALDWPSVTVRRFAGRSGSGRFGGTATVVGENGGYRTNVDFEIKDLPLVQNFQTRAYLTLRMLMNVTTDAEKVARGSMKFTNGLLRVPAALQKNVQSLDPHPDFEFAGEESPAAEEKRREAAEAAERDPDEKDWRAQIRVEVPDDFRVELPLGSMVVFGARLDTRWDPALKRDGGPAFDVEGKVNLVRGTIDFIKKFEIEKGLVQIYPRRFKDPALDIRAVHENAGTKVIVDIGGTVSKMTKTFTSEPSPSMSEAEILYFLATGQRQMRAQTEDTPLESKVADATASLLGSMVTSGINKLLPKEIALDVVSVETNLASGSVGRARLGKYISDRVYVGGQYNPDARQDVYENKAQVELEYRFGEGNGTYVRVLGGDAGRYGAEFLYQTQVPSEAQQKSGQKK